MKNADLENYRAVQGAARRVLEELKGAIAADSTEESIAGFASDRLADLGFPDTWYHSCPALVLAGSRTSLSLSGRDYIPNKKPIGVETVVTVDLSPCKGKFWGDCARSFLVEGEKVSDTSTRLSYRRGMETQRLLHAEMKSFVSPKIRFNELYEFINAKIAALGFVNLDYLGNVGHSIAEDLDSRVFIDAYNLQPISSVQCFTFEPHIREVDGVFGYKHENIYYFDDIGELTEL
ncbi:MAG: M24 family metallopeptidase [Pseudomonadota bacterium]